MVAYGETLRFARFLGGLFYDDQALAEAEAYIADWSIDEMEMLRNAVPKKPFRRPSGWQFARSGD